MSIVNSKKCSTCGEIKEASAFGERSDRPGKLKSRCNACRVREEKLQRDPAYVPPPKPTVEMRFWSKVDKKSDVECWPWKAARFRVSSYGQFDGRGAHRKAWSLTNGPIPDGLVVRHTCDNPPCCNPAHLLTGTAYDNVHDAIDRNRFTSGDRNGMRIDPSRVKRGEDHWTHKRPELVKHGSQKATAKLSEANVTEILAKMSGGATPAAMAREYKVCKKSITNIIHGKTWTHVTSTTQATSTTPEHALERATDNDGNSR